MNSRKHRLTQYKRELEEIFGSLEFSLYEKLEQADWILARIATEASAQGVPADIREKYIKEKLIDMFDQIAERREGR